MKVPFLNLYGIHEPLKSEFQEAFNQLFHTSDFIRGKDIELFEDEFSQFAKIRHCISVANGTDALILALKAMGVKAGDEVITAANTFLATVEAAICLGARVRLVDVEPDTFLMSAKSLEKAITSKTRVIIPVHLYGQMVNMEEIKKLADQAQLAVLEDAAQAHGASDRAGYSPGNYGVAATYSFFPGKNLGAWGDAGCIVTENNEFAELCGRLRNHGSIIKYQHEMMGYNSRLDTFQAKILRIKLKHLPSWNLQRQKVVTWYTEELSGLKAVRLPRVQEGYTSAWHLFVIRAPRRDQLQKFLAECNIETGLHYPVPVHLTPACRDLGYSLGQFPITEEAAETMLSLPMCPTLERNQVSYVCEKIREFYSKA